MSLHQFFAFSTPTIHAYSLKFHVDGARERLW